MPKCRFCDFQAPYPGAIRNHYKDKHPDAPPKRKYTRRDVTPAAQAPVGDAETRLLLSATELFVNAETDGDGDARVLRYLNDRFGPIDGTEGEDVA